MKKITDFIVDKRYFILVLFIILTGVSLVISGDVKINYDIAKYLPKSSSTRIGMDIMEDEFESNSSTLNIMLEDLSIDEKNEALKYLEDLDNVSDVTYDESDEYNRDNYTLYILTIDASADSKEAKNTYQEIEKHFDDKLVDTSGDVSNYNKTVLPFYIILLAVGSALVILIIMSESYVEPFLFLTSILIAVALNRGTNIIFDNVSNITNSICAILQMALSMDYSIMLMNRYRQEREGEKDKVKAMKKALHHAFKSISSSSVTTIVGLLALVFMSFTIGKDLGFVLAKGVLLSLLSIFACLPGLILLFDKLIIKTKKKSPIFKVHLVGKIAHKCRHVATILFIIIFIASYFLKGNLGIVYTQSGTDKIDEVFDLNNQMAIIYPNEYEEFISSYCKTLEDEEKIDDVLCYGNTINMPLKYDELNDKLKDLGSDTDVEDYLLKIVYYHYYNPKEDNQISLSAMVNFIKETIYDNDKMNKDIDDAMKKDIDRLTNFIEVSEINKSRSAKEIASVLNISEDKVDDLLIYYNSKNSNTKMTLTEFVNFMNNTILNDDSYSKSIDTETKNDLKTISKFINKNTINKKMSFTENANVLGMDKNSVKSLYTYYLINSDITTKLSINEFSTYVLNDVLTDKNYSNLFDKQTKNDLILLNTFSNKNIIEKPMNSTDLSRLLQVPEEDVKSVFVLVYGKQDNQTELTIKEFVEGVKALKEAHYLDDVDVSAITSLPDILLTIPDKYTATGLSNFFKTFLSVDEQESIYYLYALIDVLNGRDVNWTLTPYQFVNVIINNQELVKDEELIKKIQTLNFVMTSTLNNQKYTYQEMSKNFNISLDTTKSIYSLYLTNDLKLSPYEFISFILNHQNDSTLKNSLTKDNLNDLNLAKKIMDSVINNKTYSKQEMANFLGISEDKLSLIYSLYDVKVNKIQVKVSFKNFINFLVKDVMNNQEYSSNFDTSMKNRLKTVNSLINDSLNNKKYNKDSAYSLLSNLTDEKLDRDLIELVYIYYGSVNNYKDDYQMTIEEFVRYLNEEILADKRFEDYIEKDMKQDILDAKDTVGDAKDLLVGTNYSRVVLNTKFDPESDETFAFIKNIKDYMQDNDKDVYVIGDSLVAYEMSETFQDELNLITVLTMIFIFVVVVITFKSVLIPIILVLLIQCAVFLTMGILSFGGSVYFISILIVQSILMGATIDYAILYTSYYLESREKMDIKDAIVYSYNNSMHTILTSSSILVIVTFIVGHFASAVAAKICMTLSQGCLCSTILIITLLPAVLASCDKIVIRKKKEKDS